MKKKWSERVGFFSLILSGMLVIFILGVILFDIISKGGASISWDFLTRPPQQGMTEGGIFPAILGTFLVSVITVLFAVPLGMFAAIYLQEYARPGKMTRLIRLAIRNLSGVPSIVYGLFGVVLFVQMMSFGTSVLSAGLTLGLLTLPWTITACEEALKTVPKSYREGALALGATKWYTIRTKCYPMPFPE
jgi:phosphate transport system permease protein